MTTTKKNIPSLRFPRFEGEWEVKTLDKVLKIGSGRDYKHLNEGEIPLFGTGGLMRYVDQNLYEGETVFIGRKGTIDKPKYFNGKFWTVDTLFYTYGFEKSEPFFVYLLFQRINWKKYNEASGVPSLSKTTILSINSALPSLPEQQKIANFLTAIDEKIQQLQKQHRLLKDYKKGMMQRLFSQELRFKDEDGKVFGDWEVKRLGEVADRSILKNKKSEVKTVFTNSAISGIVNQRDYFDKDIANAHNLEGYYIVKKNDFIYNPRISNHAPVGPVKINKIGTGVMSPLYSVFKFNKGILTFFEYYFESSQWYKYMKSVANYGVRFDRMNITNEDFFKMPIPFPKEEEQQKIANYLTSLDTKINQLSEQIAATQLYKKGLLQQMFC